MFYLQKNCLHIKSYHIKSCNIFYYFQVKQLANADERIKLMNEMLSGIKVHIYLIPIYVYISIKRKKNSNNTRLERSYLFNITD